MDEVIGTHKKCVKRLLFSSPQKDCWKKGPLIDWLGHMWHAHFTELAGDLWFPVFYTT